MQQPGAQELFAQSAGNGSRISVEVPRPPARLHACLPPCPPARGPAARVRVFTCRVLADATAAPRHRGIAPAAAQDLFKSMVAPGAPAPKQAPTPPQSTGRWEPAR